MYEQSQNTEMSICATTTTTTRAVIAPEPSCGNLVNGTGETGSGGENSLTFVHTYVLKPKRELQHERDLGWFEIDSSLVKLLRDNDRLDEFVRMIAEIAECKDNTRKNTYRSQCLMKTYNNHAQSFQSKGIEMIPCEYNNVAEHGQRRWWIEFVDTRKQGSLPYATQYDMRLLRGGQSTRLGSAKLLHVKYPTGVTVVKLSGWYGWLRAATRRHGIRKLAPLATNNNANDLVIEFFDSLFQGSRPSSTAFSNLLMTSDHIHETRMRFLERFRGHGIDLFVCHFFQKLPDGGKVELQWLLFVDKRKLPYFKPDLHEYEPVSKQGEESSSHKEGKVSIRVNGLSLLGKSRAVVSNVGKMLFK